VKESDGPSHADKRTNFSKGEGPVIGIIRNRVSTLEEAEDILQDVFYQFVAGYETIESSIV
jgi:hypothetical protein